MTEWRVHCFPSLAPIMLWVTRNHANVLVKDTSLDGKTYEVWTFRTVLVRLNAHGAVTRRSRVP